MPRQQEDATWWHEVSHNYVLIPFVCLSEASLVLLHTISLLKEITKIGDEVRGLTSS